MQRDYKPQCRVLCAEQLVDRPYSCKTGGRVSEAKGDRWFTLRMTKKPRNRVGGEVNEWQGSSSSLDGGIVPVGHMAQSAGHGMNANYLYV